MGWKVDKTKQRSNPVQFKLHNEALPVVKLGEAYKYQGLNDALEIAVHSGQIFRVIAKGSKNPLTFVSSEILPLQKLAAMRTFVTPRLDCHLRHCYPYKQHSIAFDRHRRAVLKQEFKLGKGTANACSTNPFQVWG